MGDASLTWRMPLLLAAVAVVSLATLLTTLQTGGRIDAAARRLLDHLNARQEQEIMVTTRWQSADGEREVTTKQTDSESWTDLLNRHDVEVAAAQVKWPKV